MESQRTKMTRDERLIRPIRKDQDRTRDPDDGPVLKLLAALLPCDSKWEFPRNQLVLGIS